MGLLAKIFKKEKVDSGCIKSEDTLNIGVSTALESEKTDINALVAKCTTADIYSKDEFNQLIDGNEINCSIVIRNETIDSFKPATKINGSLGLSECSIQTLSPLKTIKSDIWCSFYYKAPSLVSLGTLERVEGNANFRYMPLEDLGKLKYVGGNLSLRDTKIKDLGELNTVGGNLYLPMRLKGTIDLSKISVGGQVSYWNDAKTNRLVISNTKLHKSPIPVPYWRHTYIYPYHRIEDESSLIQEFYKFFKESFFAGKLLDTEGCLNYCFLLVFDLKKQIKSMSKLSKLYATLSDGYPKLKSCCDSILIDLYITNQEYAAAWEIEKTSPILTINTVRFYVDKMGNEILDGAIALKICGNGCLSEFGRTHIEEIYPFFNRCMLLFAEKYNSSFLDVFYDEGKGYKIINGGYNPEYYRQFYELNESDFTTYYEIGKDEYHSKRLDDILVVEHAVIEQLRVLFIKAEGLYREYKGIPQKGEGWISETMLYHKVSNYYKSYEVIQHGRPKWLGKQHLDIYFPKENIGIEYQGIQHYKPVEYFGGEEGFAKNLERDARKRRLCEENACQLIFVDEGYDFMEVVKSIDLVLQRLHEGNSKSLASST